MIKNLGKSRALALHLVILYAHSNQLLPKKLTKQAVFQIEKYGNLDIMTILFEMKMIV